MIYISCLLHHLKLLPSPSSPSLSPLPPHSPPPHHFYVMGGAFTRTKSGWLCVVCVNVCVPCFTHCYDQHANTSSGLRVAHLRVNVEVMRTFKGFALRFIVVEKKSLLHDKEPAVSQSAQE